MKTIASPPLLPTKGQSSLPLRDSRIAPHPLDDNERLVFFHIRKCGGTTLHHFLLSRFKKAHVCPERFNNFDKLDQEKLRQYRLFSSHLSSDRLEYIPSPRRVFTFLREPRARWISHYQFFQTHSDEHIASHNLRNVRWAKNRPALRGARELPSAEPLMVRYQFDNHLTRVFLGEEGFSLPAPLIEHPQWPNLIQQAWRQIGQLDFIGFVEQYDQSVNALCHWLDWPVPKPLEPLNTFDQADKVAFQSKIPPINLTEELKHALQPLIHLDTILYQRATRGWGYSIFPFVVGI